MCLGIRGTSRRMSGMWQCKPTRGSIVAAAQDGAALAYLDPRTLIDDRVFEPLCRILNAEGMSTAATSFCGFAAFIFPVIFAKKGDIDSPDGDHLALLQTPCRVDGVTPNDVPASVVVMGLQRPGASRRFGLQSLFRWWT